jgi:branched-chain amino acid aminotransferase
MAKRYPLIITSIDGRLVPARLARISVIDNSFLYAEGLFETLLAVDDRLIFAKRHMTRLVSGAKVIGLKLPVSISQLRRWMIQAASRHPARYKKVRLTVTSGDSARWIGRPGKPRVVISVSEHQLPVEPYRLLLSDLRVDQKSPFRRIKTVSYAIQAAAFRRAIERGYDDALLLNENRRVAEVTSANIFWVRRNTLYTSPLSAGCLDGVTRKAVIAVAGRLKIPLVERNETFERMVTADEIFICSSLKLVIGVTEIAQGKRQYRISEGPLTVRIREYFREIIDADNPLSR